MARRRRRRRIRLGALAGAGLLAGRALTTRLPAKAGIEARLAAFPTEDLPLEAPVTIHWDGHQIPFIEARTDADLAVALGLVHAHLRLGQMTLMRRIATGRLAESAGPLAADIDVALRMIDFGRVAAQTEREMPPETRGFVEAFVAGINHYQDTAKVLPHEFRVLAMRPEPWTVRDAVTVGRLAGADINWLVWFRLLRLRDRADWPALWAELVRAGSDSAVSFGPPPTGIGGQPREAAALGRILRDTGKSGSNSVAVAGSRTATGAALIASDPHLGITAPNLWLIAGIKSPSHHAVGLMIPGLPFIAVGRNPEVAWGGTNMRAASSDLYDVSGLADADFGTRRERIRVRWGRTREVEIRESPVGPVISDAPPLGWAGRPLALRWIGHERGDEITAMIRASQARNWEDFRAAFATFAVSAQNMLYADARGNIGQVMATILPVRPNRPPPDMILDAGDRDWRWQGVRTAVDLPAAYNPAAGVLASANNRPTDTDLPVGWFFSADDRVRRMQQLLAGDRRVGAADLERLQRDVYMASSVALRDAALARLDGDGTDPPHGVAGEALALLRDWDGHYRVDSRGAVAFELFAHYLTQAHFAARFDGKAREAIVGFARTRQMVTAAVEAGSADVVAPMIRAALRSAGARIGAFDSWGAMHRLRIGHPLAAIPLVGRRYRFADLPTAGSSDTLMKTAHGSAAGRHATSYGQQARHVSDLSDPDANWFALLGGQDGWLSSSTAFDQVALWRRGDYVEVPLRPETVRRTFPHRLTLTPRATRPAAAG